MALLEQVPLPLGLRKLHMINCIFKKRVRYGQHMVDSIPMDIMEVKREIERAMEVIQIT